MGPATLADEAWGPCSAHPAPGPHPIANAVCRGVAENARVEFAGGRIDALLICHGSLLRTAAPDSTACGIAQVRRYLERGTLRVLHLVFAPEAARPLLLGLVRLENRGEELLPVEYTEIWDVAGEAYASAPGGAERRDVDGLRVLADLGVGVRSRVPETVAPRGLALELTLVLPPRSRRDLCFGYARGDPDEERVPALRALRGEVRPLLADTVRGWMKRLPETPDPVAAYRAELARMRAVP